MNVPSPRNPDDSLNTFLNRPAGTLPKVNPEHVQYMVIRVMDQLATKKKIKVEAWAAGCPRAHETVRNVLKADKKSTPRNTLECMANVLDCHLYALERLCTDSLLSGEVRVVRSPRTGKLKMIGQPLMAASLRL